MKAQQKAEIKVVFGERMSTNLLINLIALFPKLLETVLELITVWKAHKAKANKLMGSPTCNKNDPNDPHYGQAGSYDDQCVWHPWVIQE